MSIEAIASTASNIDASSSGQRRGITGTIRRCARRSAIEPLIDRMKTDGRLDSDFLAGMRSDAINAPLCGAGSISA